MNQYSLFEKEKIGSGEMDNGEGLRNYVVGLIEDDYKGKRYGQVINGITNWFLIGKVEAVVGDHITVEIHNYFTIKVYLNGELKWTKK